MEERVKMRLIISHMLLLLLLFSFPALALQTFSDMPKGHWSGNAVYSLVKSGITSGYPDGTFRGNKSIDRYEMASLAFQLYQSLAKTKAAEEKVYHELLSELSLAKYDLQKIKEYSLKQGGDFQIRLMRAGSLRTDYRLKYQLARRLADSANIRLELDTLDAGFNDNAVRSLTLDMLSLSAGYDAGNFIYKADFGPGNVLHNTQGLVPSEDYTFYQKIRPGITIASQPGWFQYSVGYLVRQIADSGKTILNELNANATFTLFKFAGLKKINFIFDPRYVVNRIRGEITSRLIFTDDAKLELALGLGEMQYDFKGAWAGAKLELNNLWPGLDLNARLVKVGSKFRPAAYPTEFDLYNYFNRAMLDGFVDFGFSFKQKINSGVSVFGILDSALAGDWKYGKDYAKTYLLYRLGFNVKPQNYLSFDAYYECLQVPSQIDQFTTLARAQNGVGVLQGKFSF